VIAALFGCLKYAVQTSVPLKLLQCSHVLWISTVTVTLNLAVITCRL